MIKKAECVVCGSRECGLVQDPIRDNDYICATCLFRERDDAIASLADKEMLEKIRDLDEVLLGFTKRPSSSIVDTLRTAKTVIEAISANLSIARDDVWYLRDFVESLNETISEQNALLDIASKLRTSVSTESLAKLLASSMISIYECNRDWSAWKYGTMTEADFNEVDVERVASELSEAILGSAVENS